MKFSSGIAAFLFLIASFYSSGQTISSPYTNFGIGEITDFSLPHNEAMGGLGIAVPETLGANLKNPALSVNNVLTIFQVGFKGDFRDYLTNETTGSSKAGSLRYLTLSFPIKSGKWTSSISLLPKTFVNYNITNSRVLTETGEIIRNEFLGTGGLSQVVWSHGVKFLDNLSFGVRASYLFGSIANSVENSILSSEDQEEGSYRVQYVEQTSYNDFLLGLSAAYKHELSAGKFLNFGLVADIGNNLNGETSTDLARFSAQNAVISSVPLVTDEQTNYELPLAVGIGFAYHIQSKLSLGLDVEMQQWKGTNSQQSEDFRNSLKLIAGGKYIPDYKSVNSYFQRINYRFGVVYKQLPYVISETNINEFGINFGVSLPVSGASTIDTAFKVGRRGTTSNDLVRENFYQIVFGISINDRWFIKRKYD